MANSAPQYYKNFFSRESLLKIVLTNINARKKKHKLILLGYEVLLELYRITAIELAGAVFID